MDEKDLEKKIQYLSDMAGRTVSEMLNEGGEYVSELRSIIRDVPTSIPDEFGDAQISAAGKVLMLDKVQCFLEEDPSEKVCVDRGHLFVLYLMSLGGIDRVIEAGPISRRLVMRCVETIPRGSG